MRKKFLALLLALVMLLSLVPFAAFAEEESETTTEGLVMSKTATLENDGTYTINLSAYSTGSTTTQSVKTGVPLDIVIIMDQSGSMAYGLNSSNYVSAEADTRYYKLRTEVKNFVDSIAANAAEYKVEHRVALVGFANGNSSGTSSGSLCHTSADSNSTYWMNTGIFIGGKLKNYGANSSGSTKQLTEDDYQTALYTIPTSGTVPTALSSAYANIAANGGTYTEYGLELAADVFKYNAQRSYTDENGDTAQSQRIVILFTDGDSNSDDDDNIGGAYTLKNTYGAKVYTVSMLSSSNDVLNYMSSNYPTISRSSDANTTTTYEETYDISTSETYYVKNSGWFGTSYDEVQYGSYNIETYGYTPLSGGLNSLDTSKTYYILNNGSYTEIYHIGNTWYYGFFSEVSSDATIYERYVASTTTYTGWYYEDGWGNRTNYTPKTSSSDSTNTQFYKKIVTGGIAASDTKYYTNISNMSDLGDIFTNIVEDVTSSTTSVTLDATSYMQDVLAAGFALPSDFATNTGSYVTVTTKTMTLSNGVYTEGGATATSSGLTVTPLSNGVKVSGFDYSTKYVASGHNGEILKVTITGILPTDDAVTNTIIDTNDASSGIHGKDASGNEVNFAFEQPKTILTSKAYVVDYAKPFSVSASDWKQSSVTAYVEELRKVTSDDSIALDLAYGKIDGTTYTPQTTNWNGYDNIYAFGKTTDETVLSASANKVNSNLWSKVNVIPANNVYYEDDFVATTPASTTTDGETTVDNSSVQIVSNGNNSVSTESAESSETGNGAGVQGWETALADDTAFSDGSATKLTTGAKASFTFTGTGVDIYSYTDMTTGVVTAALNKMNGESVVSTKYMMVDNLAVSGEYYQIPTLSWNNLDYGTYTVTLVVNNAKAPETYGDGSVKVDAEGNIVYSSTDKRTTYYLDGIRVYNPLGNDTTDEDQKISDTTVKDAYGETELNALFTEVRDLLDTSGDGSSQVFIDLDGDGNVEDKTAYNATEYGTYGPKNEVYLAPGQTMTFKIAATETAHTYQIGLKAPEGATSATWSGYADYNYTNTIDHSTDLYYLTTPTDDGSITISNTGDNLLSVTKIKTTNAAAAATLMLLDLTEEEASTEIAAFSLRSTVAYTAAAEEEVPEETTPEETVPEETTPEETVPEETEPEVPEIDIEIENPTEPEPEQKPENKPAANEALKDLVKNLFNKIFGWFGR